MSVMKNFRQFAFAVAAFVSAAGTAHGNILDFEELHPSPALYDILPSPYGGLNFAGWYVGPDTVYQPSSGQVDIFTDFADPANPYNYVVTDSNNRIAGIRPFYFAGASFSGFSGVAFRLWRNGELVHTSDWLADALGDTPYGPTFLSSGYSDLIDVVTVLGVQGFFAMDDFTYSMPDPPFGSAPSPSTAWLLLSSLGGAAIASRKRRSLRCESTPVV